MPRKPTAALAIIALLAAAVSACSARGDAAAPPGHVVLRYQGSANAVLLPELAEDLGYLGDVKLKWVGNTISGPQDIQSAATGQTDFGGAFTGAVVKLIKAGAPAKAVINYYGEDAKTFNGFYVKADSSIHTARDLIGKTIGVNTLGAHSEAVIDTYLTKNGLTQAEIKKVQLVPLPPNSTEEALRKGQIDVGALGGILQDHAVATGGLRSLFSDYALFGAFDGGQYVLRDDFVKKNPEASRTFVTAVAKAIEWERTTPKAKVIAEFTKIVNGRHRNESTANLKYWKSVGIPSHGGLISDHDFTIWTSWLSSARVVKADAFTPAEYYTNDLNGLKQ
ncbi:MAG TPA: ABC transporter substrate-binding protein [Jatrophihabitantaceae bacterium]|jgi:ABC-type nitrate/sulfonate/bicarbonate transport system substrate-binding protein